MTSWFFIEMAAKSAIICTVALLLAMALRSRAAADRATVLRVGAGLLVSLPLIDTAFPVLQIEAFAAPAAPALSELSTAEFDQLLALAATAPPAAPTIWDDPTPLILILWAAGALAVLGRLLIGLATLNRWTRAAEPATDPVWLDAMERARAATGASDRLRLLVSDQVPGPLGWGLRHPVILIDYDTYAEQVEADAIMAHEVAHVARRDWPALMMTRLATALFWFNPLVWTLAREAVQQAEEAADAHAARTVEPTFYAETLLSWGQIGRGIAVPANSIAPGAKALSRRVRAVLDANMLQRSARSRLAVVAVLLCAGVAGPVAALELVEASRPQSAPTPPTAPAPPAPGAAARAPAAPDAPAPRRAAEAPPAPPAPHVPEVDVEPALTELREVLPRIPVMVRKSLQGLDAAALDRALRQADTHRMTQAQIEEALARFRAAKPDLERLRRHLAEIDPVKLEAQMRRSMPDPRELQARIRQSMAAGRHGMAHGARSMEGGADKMEQQARRLRNSAERERIIVEERARGRTVTHDELIGAADGLERGARRLREGAEQMRRSMG